MDSEALRRLPAVHTLVEAPELAPLVARLGRPAITEATRRTLARARAAIQRGEPAPAVDAAAVAAEAEARDRPSLRRVINATGVVLHTNLGRAPLAAEARAAVDAVAAGYSTLELDLGTGQRGSRHAHVGPLLVELLGAEDGIAVNNCAGAVLLMLAAVTAGRRVAVSRGELVEIGGGFRVPDVMRASGAELVEIGTTNKVHLRDYARALDEGAQAILVVHRSNFALVGFVAQPSLAELAELARARGVPLLVDVGSGLLAGGPEDPALAAVARDEPRPIEVLAAGADLVAFSADKLMGGPQAGLLVGRGPLVEACRRHPLARALRIDKLSLAALEATLRLYRDGRDAALPALASLRRSPESLAEPARRLALALATAGHGIELGPVESVVGGGALPLARIPSLGLRLAAPGGRAEALLAALRRADPPVLARAEGDAVVLDLRTVADEEIPALSVAVRAALTELGPPDV